MNLLLLGGSLVGVLGLALVAQLLGLGTDPRIIDEDHARSLAEEAHCGFTPVEIAVDHAGGAALLRDAGGRHLLIRPHGNHFAARFIEQPFYARLDRKLLTLGASDAMFGRVTLDLGERAAHWASGLRNA
jgi:hypothetical protein